MSRRRHKSSGELPKRPFILFRLVSAAKLRKAIPGLIGVVVAASLVASAHLLFPRQLPLLWWCVLGVVCGPLAVAIYLWVTRPRESPEEALLHRIRRGQHADFGKRLRQAHAKARTVKLPVLGETRLRVLGGVAVFLAAVGWWIGPLGPVRIKERDLEDLAGPLEEEIVAVVLGMPNAQMAILQPPLPPPLARQRAGLIDDRKADHYHRGLKAIALGRFDEARGLLAIAMRDEEVTPFAIHVARAQNEMYAGSAERAIQWYQTALQKEPDDPILLCQTAVAWMQTGEFEAARPFVARALRVCREKPAQHEMALGICLHVQAVLYVGLGQQYLQAEQMCQQARELLEKALEREHPVRAASYNNQAVLYLLQAKYSGARELNRRAEEFWGRTLGAGDPRVADSLANQALLHYQLAEFGQALELIERAAAIRARSLPPDHPVVALGQSPVALIHLTCGDSQPLPLALETALTVCEKGFGPDHPSAPAVLDALGLVYAAQARYNKAESRWRRAESLAKKTSGDNHLSRAGILNHWAELCVAQGRLAEAEGLCRQAREITKQAHGPRHPSVALVLRTSGRLEAARAQPESAAKLLTEALAIQEETLGKDHPEVARTLDDLARLNCQEHGSVQGAAQYKRALKIHESRLGPEHPDVARLLFGLAKLDIQQNNLAEARMCLERARVIQEKTLVHYHPDLAATLEVYATVLRRAGPPDPERAAQAAEFESRAKSIRSQHAEEDRPE